MEPLGADHPLDPRLGPRTGAQPQHPEPRGPGAPRHVAPGVTEADHRQGLAGDGIYLARRPTVFRLAAQEPGQAQAERQHPGQHVLGHHVARHAGRIGDLQARRVPGCQVVDPGAADRDPLERGRRQHRVARIGSALELDAVHDLRREARQVAGQVVVAAAAVDLEPGQAFAEGVEKNLGPVVVDQQLHGACRAARCLPGPPVRKPPMAPDDNIKTMYTDSRGVQR